MFSWTGPDDLVRLGITAYCRCSGVGDGVRDELDGISELSCKELPKE